MLIDVVKLCHRREVVLAGGDAADLFAGHVRRHPQSEIGKIVSDRVFEAGAVAPDVVEGRVDGHEAKLAFIYVVAVHPEVAVLREHQLRRDLMDVAGVPGVVGFRVEADVQRYAWTDAAGGVIQRGDTRRNALEVRDLEVAREAGVDSGVAARLVDKIYRRTELAVVDEAACPIPSRSEIHAELFVKLPRVLKIDAVDQVDLVEVGGDGNGDGQRHATLERKHLRRVVRLDSVLAEIESAAQRVIVPSIGEIALRRV